MSIASEPQRRRNSLQATLWSIWSLELTVAKGDTLSRVPTMSLNFVSQFPPALSVSVTTLLSRYYRFHKLLLPLFHRYGTSRFSCLRMRFLHGSQCVQDFLSRADKRNAKYEVLMCAVLQEALADVTTRAVT